MLIQLVLGVAAAAAAGFLGAPLLGGARYEHSAPIVFTLVCAGVLTLLFGGPDLSAPPSPRGLPPLLILGALAGLCVNLRDPRFLLAAAACAALITALSVRGLPVRGATLLGALGFLVLLLLLNAALAGGEMTKRSALLGRLSSSHHLLGLSAMLLGTALVLASGPLLLWVFRLPHLALASLVPVICLAGFLLGYALACVVWPSHAGAGWRLDVLPTIALAANFSLCCLFWGVLHGRAGWGTVWIVLASLAICLLIMFAVTVWLANAIFGHGSSLPRG